MMVVGLMSVSCVTILKGGQYDSLVEIVFIQGWKENVTNAMKT